MDGGINEQLMKGKDMSKLSLIFSFFASILTSVAISAVLHIYTSLITKITITIVQRIETNNSKRRRKEKRGKKRN